MMDAESPRRPRSWPPPDADAEDMLFNADRSSETSTLSAAMGRVAASRSAKAAAAAVAVCLSLLLVASHVTMFYAGMRDKPAVEADCTAARLSPPPPPLPPPGAAGGWTVIMRRGQFGLPADYFRRNYVSYLEGFGDPKAEFWLGLDRIRALAGGVGPPHELLVRMTTGDGRAYEARYDGFALGPAPDFVLILGDNFEGNSSSGGDALADGLGWMNGSAFSAPDRDRDDHFSANCAQERDAGYW